MKFLVACMIAAVSGVASPQVVLNPAVQYPAGGGITSIFARDLDGDGFPDVVVENDHGVSVLPSLGMGVLGPRLVFSTGPATATHCAPGDLDGDGDEDCVVGSWDPYMVATLIGTGSGTFGPPTNVPASDFPYVLATGDLDGDGDVDVAAGTANTGTILIYLNDGLGNLSPGTSAFSTNVRDLVVVDMDADGDLDLVATKTESSGGRVRVLLNGGSGTFSLGADVIAGTMGVYGPTGLDVGDVDGDGVLDVVVSHGESGSTAVGVVGVLRGQGGGALGSVTEYTVGVSNAAVRAADLNGDGAPEIVTVDQTIDHVHVLANDGIGGFPAQLSVAVGQNPWTSTSRTWTATGWSTS